jgi:hypothetical protein
MADGAHAYTTGEPRFLPLTAGDWQSFRAQFSGALRDLYERVEIDPHPGLEAWTYRRGGIMRGVGGIGMDTPWRWVLWSFPGELSMADWKRVIRFTRARVKNRLAQPGVRRIWASASVDQPGAQALLERLGFSLEGVMRLYGPMGDERLYAIVRGDSDPEHG